MMEEMIQRRPIVHNFYESKISFVDSVSINER